MSTSHIGSKFKCEDKICKSKLDLFMNTSQTQKTKKTDTIGSPLDRDSLGNITWSMLHTMAAYYPDKPCENQRSDALNFMIALGTLYPCSYCANDFRKEIKKNPPRVENREDFSVWMCEQHNVVNKKLGKNIFPCKLSDLDARWKTGDTNSGELNEASTI